MKPAGSERPSTAPPNTAPPSGSLLVRRAGPLSTIQDHGRPRRASQGVACSGAADPGALLRANGLVGNPDDFAGIEVTLGGLIVEAIGEVTVAVTGAPCPLGLSAPDQVGARPDVAIRLASGQRLSLGRIRHGLRAYVGVRGGIDVAPVLGSRSWDCLGRIGPPPLRVGDVVPVGALDDLPAACWVPIPAPALPEEPVLRVTAGWRPEWFGDGALAVLVATRWVVQPASDRTGLRLGGPLIPRLAGELPSEATIVGALQVPPSGQPILLGPDCGTTGGYPVLAVVRRADLGLAAQVRPGGGVRFEVR